MIGHVVACYGAADRYLGMLAARSASAERAERHFERALELNRRMGARDLARAHAYEYGRMLLARGARHAARRRCSPRPTRSPSGSACRRCSAGIARARRRPRRADAARRSVPPRGRRSSALVAEGLSNREIGAALFISEHTAANHIRSILRKTRCANRTEAASYAHRHGLVELRPVGSRACRCT